MPADIFYTGGTSHDHCQDYAFMNKKYDGFTLMALCDGCSSAPHSEIGAILVAHTSMRIQDLRREFSVSTINDFVNYLSISATMINISYNCLAATLLCMEEYEDGVQVIMIGDGLIYGKRRDGSSILLKRMFPSGAPYYIYYHKSKELIDKYKKEFSLLSLYTSEEYNKDASETSFSTNYNEELVYRKWFSREEFESVTLFTDGVLSFVPEQELIKVVRELTSFKNTAGRFLDRRVKRFLKECSKENITHYDDLGLGTILL